MADPASIFFAVAATTAAYGTVQAGKAQAYQYKAEANQAKMQARDVEIARRQKLLQALAERQVATAAGGATLEGTPGVLINESQRQANLDALSLEGMTASKISTLNAAARNARTVANIGAAAELLSAGSKIAGSAGGSATVSKSSIGTGSKAGSSAISASKSISKGPISGGTVPKISG
jgi:hypothetical protein